MKSGSLLFINDELKGLIYSDFNDKKEKELENATAKILKRKERKDLKKERREAKNKKVLASKSSEIAN